MSDPDTPGTESIDLHTTVGRTVQGENFFRGFGALHELLGAEQYWTLVSMAVDGPRLTDRQCRICDAISASLLVPDARLWLFKASRLVASYGNALAGFAAGQTYMRGAIIGTMVGEHAARFQAEVASRIGASFADPRAMDDVVAQLVEEGAFLHGFGVPGRQEDERAVYLQRWYDDNGVPDAQEWVLFRNLERAVAELKGLPANIASPVAAAWRQMGFSPRQSRYMSNTAIVINTLCNAYDGEAQGLPAYRRLPDEYVEYVGPSLPKEPACSG